MDLFEMQEIANFHCCLIFSLEVFQKNENSNICYLFAVVQRNNYL